MRKRCDFLRKFCFVLVLFLCVNLGHAKLEIIVKSTPDWGEISIDDIQYLSQEVADRFEDHLRPENEINDNVNLYRTITTGFSFVTLDTSDPNVSYKILIQSRADFDYKTMDFAKFAHRFGHEFTHILYSHRAKDAWFYQKDKSNLWFEEVIAETGGLYALRSMADAWVNNSRFGRGISEPTGYWEFSFIFDHYASSLIKKFTYEGSGKEWLRNNEDNLRRQTNQSIIYQLSILLLPIFEEHPEAWNAIVKMPTTNSKMSEYMQVWYEAVDVQDREYVEAIAEVMGITVTSPVVAPVELTVVKIDADVNDDGYVDLYDVMIVRSGMQNSVSYDTDINNDGVTDEVDLLIVKAKAMEAIAAAAPRKRKVKLTTWGEVKSR